MSQRRKTVPPTRASSRSLSSGRSELIARKKTEKQAAKRRTALTIAFIELIGLYYCIHRHAERVRGKCVTPRGG